jgi:hypothetical protein
MNVAVPLQLLTAFVISRANLSPLPSTFGRALRAKDLPKIFFEQ